MSSSMTPEGREVWGSEGGQNRMGKWLKGQKADQSDLPTLDKLKALNKQHVQNQKEVRAGKCSALEELQREQRAHAGRNLGQLTHDCGNRLIDAAELLEINDSVVAEMREFFKGSYSVAPLYPFYEVICERYNNDVCDTQLELWADPSLDLKTRWAQYFHGSLIPLLVRNDECVRNILCVMRLLPCYSPELALDTLVNKAKSMTMPRLSIRGTCAYDSPPELYFENNEPN